MKKSILAKKVGMTQIFQEDGSIDAALVGMPYGDITAALDYYFKNFNNGRPFIIAGHSQGAARTA